jgi:hypothetical protein
MAIFKHSNAVYRHTVIICCGIQAAAMVYLLVRTYKNSKFAYIYTIATLLLLYSVIYAISSVCQCWYNKDKLSETGQANLRMVGKMC